MRDQRHELLLLLASLFLQNEKAEQAVILLEALQTLSPADPEVARQLAFAYLQSGKFAQSLSAADRYLAAPNEAGDSRSVGLIRSRALWGLGRIAEAQGALQTLPAGLGKLA